MSATGRRAGGWTRLAIAALFAGGFAAFFAFGGQQYLSLDAVKQNRDLLLGFTRDHYALMLVAAFAIYAAAVALSLPGALLLSLTTGFLFGRWVGTVLIVAAATLGALAVFLAARHLFADAARRRLGLDDPATGIAARITRGFADNAFSYLLFLRLVPLFPFWLVNLAPAFTRVKPTTFVAATAIGIVPGSFVFANLGQSLGRIDSLRGLLSGETLAALALLGVFALVPVFAKRLRRQPA